MIAQMQVGVTTTPLIAGILMYGGGAPVTQFEVVLFSVVVAAGLLVSICWGLVEEWIERTRLRDWPAVPAIIDAVGVTFVESKGISSLAVHYWPSYRATITYSYRNPERQTGSYSRSFGNEDDAKAWANSYKGETVKVHVDPHDPTRSMLSEKDL
jgi:hypothetical protein